MTHSIYPYNLGGRTVLGYMSKNAHSIIVYNIKNWRQAGKLCLIVCPNMFADRKDEHSYSSK